MGAAIRVKRGEWARPKSNGAAFPDLPPDLAYSKDFNVAPRPARPATPNVGEAQPDGLGGFASASEKADWDSVSDEAWGRLDNAEQR
jgi:hypothetical protein